MGIVRTFKNVTNGYSSSQVKVRNVTANDESTPNTNDMQDIAEMTYQENEMFLIMDMIDKRINDKGKHWKHVLKSLVLLDYLVRFGSDGVIMWCQENLYIIKTLREFHHRDDSGKDVGGSIRARARDLTELLTNQELLREERGRRGGRRNRDRPSRYRSNSSASDFEGRRSRRASASTGGDHYDDDLQRALELSKETAAQEDEMRRMINGQGDQDDLNRAVQLSQQNGTDLFNNQTTGYGMNYSATGTGGFSEADLQQYYANQQAVAQQQQQAELQRQYEAQQAQLAQMEQQQQMYQQQLAAAEQQQQQELLQQQLLQQQQQQQQQSQQQAQLPLETGSNNPFAAFNQQQQQTQAAQPAKQPALRRHKSFSRENADQLDSILAMRDAQADTFGNTGSARIPAQHTASYMVDGAGRGLTLLQTATGKQTKNTSNNPFMGQQYTGIATTQVQPAYTGFGFGNANSNPGTPVAPPQRTTTSSSLIDM